MLENLTETETIEGLIELEMSMADPVNSLQRLHDLCIMYLPNNCTEIGQFDEHLQCIEGYVELVKMRYEDHLNKNKDIKSKLKEYVI